MENVLETSDLEQEWGHEREYDQELVQESEQKQEQKPKPKQTTKNKKAGTQELQESPYYVNGESVEYYGAQPELIKWKDWVNACNVVKNSDLFKTLYKKEFFEWGAIENTACIYPVYSKEPEPVYNYDGVLIDTKPGVYDENLTLVLPPKFFFPTYRKYLISQPGLEKVLNNIEVKSFQKYNFTTKAEPRPEQRECVNLAEDELKTKKFFKGIIQAPPGFGKTYLSIRIGSITNTQIMIVVPNKILAEQWTEAVTTFTDLTIDDIGFLKGSNIKSLTKKGQMKKPILIALVQSLDSQMKRVSFEELRYFYRNVGAVFYDETHTSGAADGYAKTSGIFTTFNIIGLSATPYKKGTNLFQLYTGIGQIKYISTHQNLIPTCNMHLLPIRVTQREREDLFKSFEFNWTFFLTKLEDLLFKDHHYFTFLAEWAIYRYKQGHSTVILFKTIQMLEKLKRYIENKIKELNIEKPPVMTVLTAATAKTNKKLISTSDIVFTNFKMFSAGADFPHLSTVFFGSMVLGKIPIIQTLGRVTRKYSDKIQDVQAHFFIPDFIYPLFSSNEPHMTIVRAVKTQYPESQFKWDKGFNEFFEKKKAAAENLISEEYSNFQAQQHQGYIPEVGKGPMNGSFIVQDQNSQDNRLSLYQQQRNYQTYQNYQPTPPNLGVPGLPNENNFVTNNHQIPIPPMAPPLQMSGLNNNAENVPPLPIIQSQNTDVK